MPAFRAGTTLPAIFSIENAFCPQPHHRFAIEDAAWTSDGVARLRPASLGRRRAGAHPLADQFPFELRDRSDDVHQKFAGRIADSRSAAVSRLGSVQLRRFTRAPPAKRRGRPPASKVSAVAAPTPVRHKRRLSAAGRKAIADAAKRRWAAIKAGEATSPAAKKASKKAA
jgi:hypothetical protein